MKRNKSARGYSKQAFWGYPLVLVSLVALFSAKWYVATYGQLGFDAVLFTMKNNLSGTQNGLILAYFRDAFVPALGWSLPLGFLLYFRSRVSVNLTFFGKIKCRVFPMRGWVSASVSLVMSLALILNAATMFGIFEYINGAMHTSTLYEDEYVFPENVSVTFPEEKRNLIYIFMESAEVSFLSEEHGGAMDVETIPEMYDLALNNINFSNNDGVGGAYSLWGSTWTIGAMVAQTAGIPLRSLSGVGDNNTVADGSKFLPGVTSIMDVLHENGYYQALMVGSNGEFGGRSQYYTQHGVDRVYDLYTAYEDGIVPEGCCVWWGFEDSYLYQYAKQEILQMASGDQPFAFTMLTVDTHHIDGYLCDKCGDTFEQQYQNVFSCASHQLSEFISWIQQQDFYENTTIVITGDHPTMDAAFINRNVESGFTRWVYNCFINSAVDTENNKNRLFSTMDMFPTTLAAMGCRIEGERLGLGVNLFSGEQTLMEKYGVDKLTDALLSSSPFYNYIFIKGYEMN